MKIDLEALAKIVEERVPNTKTISIPGQSQVIVAFENRPDVEVALLTPYYQAQLRRGTLDISDLKELLNSISQIEKAELLQ